MARWHLLLVPALVLVGVACSDDASTTGSTPGAAAATTVVADSPAPVTTAAAASTTASAAAAWETVTAPSDCMCSDGSGYQFFVKRGDPTKVVFFLEGGGACFSEDTCKPGSDTYKRTVGAGPNGGDQQGIFDGDDPRNPFAGWSMVYVPYCTGDVHIGNATKDYGDGVVVQHKGYVNASTALRQMAAMFPDAAQLVVTGESAGSVPTPLYAGMAHDLLPDARITVLADGSGAYPDIPVLNATIGGAWGTADAIPDWPENAGLTVEQWSLPGLFVQAGKHDPAIVFARHDYAFDHTQSFFAGLAGIPANDLVSLIDKNEQEIEASGVTLLSYIAPGDDHTVLGKPAFYTEKVNGTAFVDWVTALVDGKPVADDHCTDCKEAG